MRSIPGTITEYKRHADQVALLDLPADLRDAAIRQSMLAEAKAEAEAAAAKVAELEG